MKELNKKFYDTFLLYNEICIYNIDEQFYYCTKQENKTLKNIYKAFDVKIPFQVFKKCCIELSINDNKNIITSANSVVDILKEIK